MLKISIKSTAKFMVYVGICDACLERKPVEELLTISASGLSGTPARMHSTTPHLTTTICDNCIRLIKKRLQEYYVRKLLDICPAKEGTDEQIER